MTPSTTETDLLRDTLARRTAALGRVTSNHAALRAALVGLRDEYREQFAGYDERYPMPRVQASLYGEFIARLDELLAA